MAEGHSSAYIARALSITERAVIQHTSNIYGQLGLPPATTTTTAFSRLSATYPGNPPAADKHGRQPC